jgi:general secretion pathway protein B
MSILLEALRKSEQAQRRGVVPGLTTAEPDIQLADERSLVWRPALLTAAGLALLVLMLGGWRLWVGQQVAETPTGAHSASRADDPSVDRAVLPPDAAVADTAMPRSVPQSPVEVLPDIPPLRSEKRVAALARPSASEAPAARPTTKEPPEPNDAAQSRQPGLISYWQLPETVRESLPALRITVLVYAEQPEDRFLLMDGRRWTEGDELGDGLRLQEIRRDGAVLSYRLYRFLREQG